MDLRSCAQMGRASRGRRLLKLLTILSGVVLLQAAGSCQATVSGMADALGNPIATGIGNGLSNLVQALVIGALI